MIIQGVWNRARQLHLHLSNLPFVFSFLLSDTDILPIIEAFWEHFPSKAKGQNPEQTKQIKTLEVNTTYQRNS